MTEETKSQIFHIVMFAFAGEHTASGIMKEIQASQKMGGYKIVAQAVVEKDGKGKVHFHEPGRGGMGAALGGITGGVLSLIGGPVGLLAWVVAGGVIGGVAGKYLGRAVSPEDLQRIGNALDLNTSAILVLVEDKAAEEVVDGMVGYNAQVITITVGDQMSGEIAAVVTGEIQVPEEKLAAEAFLYGYPLVYSLHEIAKFPAGPNLVSQQPLPYNTFGYARDLLDPQAHFVSPNNDTLYIIGVCDVRTGPLILHVPDTHDRYYCLQFVDAWSNNFAYIGRRATGTKEAHYLLTSHEYSGEIPDNMQVVHAPTGLFVIVGRLAVNGEADLPAVHALQDLFTLTPLSVYEGGPAPVSVAGIPHADPRVGEELKWWEEFRVALAAFPPPAADAPFLAVCKGLGLLTSESPYIEPNPELAKILVAGQNAAQEKIEELLQSAAKPVNGWQNVLHIFDYNLDFFEIGALDEPEWKISDRKVAYVTRAIAARAGLWGNHGYEANYQIVYVDANDQPLDSAHRYELHLETPPPVDAFWSLTMYDAHDFYLVANPIHRYSIGDRTTGLKYGSDGSVTIYMQKDSPGPDKETNWLPTPKTGNFRPIMRMYQPKGPIIDGSHLLPAINKIG